MFTSFDKALAAAILGTLSALSFFGLLPFEVTPEIEAKVSMIIAAITPLAVWLIPNKQKS